MRFFSLWFGSYLSCLVRYRRERAYGLPNQRASVAYSGRRLASVSADFADWLASAGGDDLSLGFNAGAAAGGSLWGQASASSRQQAAAALNYRIAAAGDVGMVVVAPAASFHNQRTTAADPGFALPPAGQCAVDPDAAKSGNAIQFWHPQPMPPPQAEPGSGDKKPLSMMDYGASSGTASCHDCGNQAKKDCPHQRCRTCCKSRGFDCTTHVRSTWIPTARRRERHQLGAGGSAPSAPTFPATAASKKPRLLSSQTTTTTSRTSTSNGTTPRSFDTSSSQQDASFRDGLPRHVRAQAVFRCVRVTSIDDGEDEFAYQASVSINGHMFRGFLYDQGADDGHGLEAASNDESSHAATAMRSISDLHLGSASAAPPGLYNAVSGGLILGGLGYGNTMN